MHCNTIRILLPHRQWKLFISTHCKCPNTNTALLHCTIYTAVREEIDYLMQCADTNKDGMLDYMEFTERFHTPAKNIGKSYSNIVDCHPIKVLYIL